MPYKSAALACLFLAAIGGAFYMWQTARDVPPTRSIIAGVKNKSVEDGSQDTEEEARLKHAIAFINRFTVDSMQAIPEGYETIETCGPSLTGEKDAPPFCYQVIKLNNAGFADERALPALDCKEGDIFNTCLIEQRLAYFKPDYIQNRADIHTLEKFVAHTALYANAQQIQQMTDLIATVEKSHAHLIIPPDFTHAKLKLYLAQGRVDQAVAMIKEMQASGVAYYNEYLPQIGAATTLIELGDTELAQEFIIKTQHIKFAYPENPVLLHTVEYQPVKVILQQLLIEGKGQDAIDFLKQLGPNNVYVDLPRGALCHNDILRYAYKCSPQLRKQLQHCTTEMFENLPPVPRTCATIQIAKPVPEKRLAYGPPPQAQDIEYDVCMARDIQLGYAHSPALLPMTCMDKLLWRRDIKGHKDMRGRDPWPRKHQIEAALRNILTPQP
jgi:hypothetical protein